MTAFEILKRDAVDVAVLDYDMPLMSGGELAGFVKHADLPVKLILFSGRIQIPACDLAFVDLFIDKSDGVEALLGAVESLVPRPKGESAVARALSDKECI